MSKTQVCHWHTHRHKQSDVSGRNPTQPNKAWMSLSALMRIFWEPRAFTYICGISFLFMQHCMLEAGRARAVTGRGPILLVWADGAQAETAKRPRTHGTLQVDMPNGALPIFVVNTSGQPPSLYLSDRDDTPASPCSLTSWDSSKYCCGAALVSVYCSP